MMREGSSSLPLAKLKVRLAKRGERSLAPRAFSRYHAYHAYPMNHVFLS